MTTPTFKAFGPLVAIVSQFPDGAILLDIRLVRMNLSTGNLTGKNLINF